MKTVPFIVKMDSSPERNGRRNEQEAPLVHPCNQQQFNTSCQYTPPKSSGLRKRLKSTSFNVNTVLKFLFPVLGWLPSYDWRNDLSSDMMSGLTVAVMHIPQGMAYSSLAGVPPIVGLYMAFFPVLMYFIFGSSRHVSMGTFAVVCMMAAKPIALYSTSSVHSVPLASSTPSYTPIEVATVLCLAVGAWQVVLGVCRLGSLSVLMSETLVSGFTTGAAVLVFSSQVKHAFGIKLPYRTGPLKLVYTCVDLVLMLEDTNFVSLGITLTVVATLYAYFCLKDKWWKWKFPLPIELLVIVTGTLTSKYLNLQERFRISVVGEIPTGLPPPTLPPLALLPNVLVDGLVIAVIAFSINISMANYFARKDNYKVDANQELLASGLGNIVGSLFSCLPFSASLSRSLLQHQVGGKTQLASIVSCIILCGVLNFVGPVFETLPHCVLAGIILFALKGLLMQVRDIPKAWKHSHKDGIIWLVTFLCVVLVDIGVGLGVGVIVSLGAIIMMSQYPFVHILDNLPGSDIYLESNRYHSVVPVPNTLIIRICGGLHFANSDNVQHKIEKIIKKELKRENVHIAKLVIDMSAVTFMDPASAKAFLNLNADLTLRGISLCLAKCSEHVYAQLRQSEFFPTFSEDRLFPTIHDAVQFTADQNLVINEESK